MFESVMSSLGTLGMDFIGYLVPFLFVLTIVVFFHELGHFLVARWCGIRVLVFSIGFGPELVGFNDRHGTRWKISAIPLGGYVKFFGDDNAASVPDTAPSPHDAQAERRSASSASRSAARGRRGGRAARQFHSGDRYFRRHFHGLRQAAPRRGSPRFRPDSAAAAAGFQPGDLVTAIDGRRSTASPTCSASSSTSAGKPLHIVVDRGRSAVTLTATPELREMKNNFGNVHRHGRARDQPAPWARRDRGSSRSIR